MVRFPLAFLVALTASACGGGAGDIGPVGGTFSLTSTIPRQRPRQLVSAPATASWCAADTSLTIVAVTSHGDGGTAARLHWPLKSLDTFTIIRHLGAVGTATAAWRPIEDTVRTALMGDSGLVRLEASGRSQVSGSLTTWARINDSTVARIDGTLSAIPVVTRCGSAQ